MFLLNFIIYFARIFDNGWIGLNPDMVHLQKYFYFAFFIMIIVSELSQKSFLIQALSDACVQNKLGIIKEIKQINQSIYQDGNMPYFCNQCNFTHKKGKIYYEHKKFGEIPFNFPDITPIKVEKRHLIKIVGIYGLNSESICEGIKKGDHIRAKLLKNRKITIYYGRNKIGYVNKLQTDHVAKIIQDQNLNNYYEFRRYVPVHYVSRLNPLSDDKKTYFKAPFVEIFLYSLDMEKLNKVIEGLIKLHELGHPHVEYATIYFSIRVIRYFERYAANLGHNDLIRKILEFKHSKSIKTEYGAILL